VEIFVDSGVRDIHKHDRVVAWNQDAQHSLCYKSHVFRPLKRRLQSSTKSLQFGLQVQEIKAFHRIQIDVS
jgi:hypothetical protein